MPAAWGLPVEFRDASVVLARPGHAAARIPPAGEPQPGTARRGDAASRARADPGRRRLRQDPGADHPHRLAAADRPGLARRPDGGDLHEQGRQGDAHAPVGDAALQRARHVDRHLPRPVQPLPARALEAGESAADLPDPRRGRCGQRRQAGDPRDAARRGALRAQAGRLVHRRRQGGRPAPEGHRGARRPDAEARRDLPGLRGPVPARGRGRLRRADAAQLRAAARRPAPARALPRALPPHPGRRVPGHQPAAVRLAEDVRGDAGRARRAGRGRHRRDLRGRRRRPEHLRLPGRARGQHGRLRARVPGAPADQARAQLPLLRQHPGFGQCADRAQHRPAGQEPAHRGGPGRAGAGARVAQRLRRGAVGARAGRAAAPRRHRARRDRHPLPQQRAVARAGDGAVQCRRALPRPRRAALLRARRDQACAGLSAPDREPGRRHQLPAGGELPRARHRRTLGRAAAGHRARHRAQPAPVGRGAGRRGGHEDGELRAAGRRPARGHPRAHAARDHRACARHQRPDRLLPRRARRPGPGGEPGGTGQRRRILRDGRGLRPRGGGAAGRRDRRPAAGCRHRRDHLAAGRLPDPRRAGGRRQPGPGRPGRDPDDDGARSQGAGVRRGLHHRAGGEPVSP